MYRGEQMVVECKGQDKHERESKSGVMMTETPTMLCGTIQSGIGALAEKVREKARLR